MGSIVFADSAALARLNAIVWPEIARMAMEKADSLCKVSCIIIIFFNPKLISKLIKEGKQVVVLDAAVLLEADWQNFCHEVSSPVISI